MRDASTRTSGRSGVGWCLPRGIEEGVVLVDLYRFANESAPSSCGFIRKAVTPRTRIQAQTGLVDSVDGKNHGEHGEARGASGTGPVLLIP